LIGAHYPDEMLQTQLDHIIDDPSVLVFTETISNVFNNRFINCIDQLIFTLADDELENLRPEVLLTLGGMVVSKKIKQFFRKFSPKQHWHVDGLNALDTYHCLSHHFKVSPTLFFSQFFFLTKNHNTDFQQKWLQIKNKRKIDHTDFLSKVVYSDLKAFDLILKSLPERTHLQLSNSSIIRYSQLFDLNNTLQVFCNRGTSGIDGSTSTAFGASFVQKNRTVFITGDISFLYDSNALWNKYIKKDLRIILINNAGGGIFRFIPGPKSTDALDYFETSHELNASYLCKMFDLEYYNVQSEKELKHSLKSFYLDSVKPKLLEIITPAEVNDKVLKDYFTSMDS
jgi:2-succinyl-5-enolpyruvyl-6-hydroxy-3-cyclohexene-1-carboxylate synthase